MSNSRDTNGRTLSSKSNKEIPKHDALVDYNFAVAGHAGTMCDADGEIFIKPCTQAEVDFYQSVHNYRPTFGKIIPVFMGTLDLTQLPTEAHVHAQIPGLVELADIDPATKEEIRSHLHLENRDEIYPPPPPVDVVKAEEKAPEPAKKEEWKPKEGKTRKIDTDRAVVLLNASFGYKHPNILDAKLGHMRLWADDAPQAKKDKFDSIVKNSTHQNHGFRVAGMQTWKGLVDPNEKTDPLEMDPDGYRKYNKDWGRLTVTNQNIMQKMRQFIFNKDAGIDEELGKTVARLFAKELRGIQRVIERNPAHIYSSSLLFVYEGEGQALREAIKIDAERKAKRIAKRKARRAERVRSSNRIDSGIGMAEVEDGEKDSATSDEEDYYASSDEESDDPREPSPPPAFSVKLIDFAHARFDEPNEERDDNVLFGVMGLKKLFREMSK